MQQHNRAVRGSTGSDWWRMGSTRGTWAERTAAFREAASTRVAPPRCPLSIIISPLPSVVDPAKVQSLKDMIRKDPDSVPPSMSCGSKGPMVGTSSAPSGLPPLCGLPGAIPRRDHPCQGGPVHPLRPNGVYLGASYRTYTSSFLGTCHHSQESRRHA